MSSQEGANAVSEYHLLQLAQLTCDVALAAPLWTVAYTPRDDGGVLDGAPRKNGVRGYASDM